MAGFGTAYTITNSANGTIAVASAYDNRFWLINNGTAVVTLGHATAGTAGYPLATGQQIGPIMLELGETLFAFVASGTADLRQLGNTGSR